mmetsp:Transcript_14284/g.30994  ORF Transcript_14284/g.30994 Transcript_14284/m.30994 type:complete len:101 (-) Transcript_14284:67-369(-)
MPIELPGGLRDQLNASSFPPKEREETRQSDQSQTLHKYLIFLSNFQRIEKKVCVPVKASLLPMKNVREGTMGRMVGSRSWRTWCDRLRLGEWAKPVLSTL